MFRGIAVTVGVFALAAGVPAQSTFVDDAGRAVVLPARPSRVFAAGAPADVLVYTLAP